MATKLLADAIQDASRITVLTGAGVSAASGIPTYRDHSGQWLAATPIQHQEFIEDPLRRRRYWARSAVGWPLMSKAKPNTTHHLLAKLEGIGKVQHLITQNVDGLHQAAGQQSVTDLHGRIDRAICLTCKKTEDRTNIQQRLLQQNPQLLSINGKPAPDGDAHIDDSQLDGFCSPSCLTCGGILKPDVVFFGGSVPKARIETASEAILGSDALLVVGSSLSVYSGFRFCKLAHANGVRLFAINQGATRADSIFDIKIESAASDALGMIYTTIAAGSNAKHSLKSSE